MDPQEAEQWLPVVRDYAALFFGLVVACVGILIGNAAVASGGFGLAGVGSIGRTVFGGSRGGKE